MEDVFEWDEVIRDMINQEIRKQGLVKINRATVTAINGSSINVRFPLDDKDATDILNKTNQTLTVGDSVMIVYPSGSLTGAFIGWKI